MEQIKIFIHKVPDFNKKTAGELIKCFSFFLLNVAEYPQITSANILKCFEYLSIRPYSNISAYLSSNSKGKNSIFLKNKGGGYILSRNAADAIAKEVDTVMDIPATNNCIDLSIFDNTPYYIKANANQMARCYDLGLYDASLVLMRKLFETLIIECFERYGIDGQIKESNSTFLFLSDLITKFIISNKWNVSRNLEDSIKKVKKYGDLSAHNRRFLAKKKDIDDFKFELRQCAQEIILMIDYQNWKRDLP